jgi:hypothetical protein
MRRPRRSVHQADDFAGIPRETKARARKRQMTSEDADGKGRWAILPDRQEAASSSPGGSRASLSKSARSAMPMQTGLGTTVLPFNTR